MKSATARFLSATLVALALIASGCGSNSELTGPTRDTSVTGDASAAKKPAGDKSLGVTVSAVIDGSRGGTVTNGRYSVWFAPGAFSGTQTITVTDTKSSDGSCMLGPDGLTFSGTVILTIDIKGSGWESPFATIEWWNPTTATWVDLHGIYSADSGKVYTPLAHFSTYRPRAGW